MTYLKLWWKYHVHLLTWTYSLYFIVALLLEWPLAHRFFWVTAFLALISATIHTITGRKR